MHARNLGMGGAFRSLGYGAEAVTGNPAAMSLYKRYAMELSGSWDVPLGYGLGTLALADSTTEVAAGIAYDFVTYGVDQRRAAHLTTFALSTMLGERLAVGVSARHQVLTGATNANSITLNGGLVVRILDFIYLGASGHNLLPVYNPDITRYFVGSLSALLFAQLSPAFDVRADFNGPTPRFAYMGGVEWLVDKAFPLRAGYEYDGIRGHQYVSGGVGFFDEGSGVDVAYRHELGGDEGRMVSLTLKMQM